MKALRWILAIVLGLASGATAVWALVSTAATPSEAMTGDMASFRVVSAPMDAVPENSIPEALTTVNSPFLFFESGDVNGIAAQSEDRDTVFVSQEASMPDESAIVSGFNAVEVRDIKELQGRIPTGANPALVIPLSAVHDPVGLYVFENLAQEDLASLVDQLETEGYDVEIPGGGRVAGFESPIILGLFVLDLVVLAMIALGNGMVVRALSRQREARAEIISGVRPGGGNPVALASTAAVTGTIMVLALWPVMGGAQPSGAGLWWAGVVLLVPAILFAVTFYSRVFARSSRTRPYRL